VTSKETAGREGKGEDGRARCREASTTWEAIRNSNHTQTAHGLASSITKMISVARKIDARVRHEAHCRGRHSPPVPPEPEK